MSKAYDINTEVYTRSNTAELSCDLCSDPRNTLATVLVNKLELGYKKLTHSPIGAISDESLLSLTCPHGSHLFIAIVASESVNASKEVSDTTE